MLAAVGQPVPDTPHAVSVSLPSWKATVGYEEGEDWVVSKMMTGYPRFFIHLTIQELQSEVLKRYGSSGESVMLFPSPATAQRCQRFFHDKVDSLTPGEVHLLQLVPQLKDGGSPTDRKTVFSSLACVFFPSEHTGIAKQFWQHSGDGISSRRGEFCLQALREGLLHPATARHRPKHEDQPVAKGPRRYQRGGSQNNIVHHVNGHANGHAEPLSDEQSEKLPEGNEYSLFVEERFGRNLNAALASKAKLAIRRRIAGCLVDDSELDEVIEASDDHDHSNQRTPGLTENDVYLYPTGMSSIFNTHRILMANHGNQRPQLKSICFGFPYIDTLKILQKWGAGCLFYGHGSASDLDDLERRLEAGERYLALFTEFPGNPLLDSPNLTRIRHLADTYSFAVVIDETVGNLININVLPCSDIVVSSLTKVFSGDSNVMGGSCVLNPQSRMYDSLKKTIETEYEDNYWAEDAVFMERNSRDFISRIHRTNLNTGAMASFLASSPLVKRVYYPALSPSRPHYDARRTPNGGYGGLLSVTFHHVEHAVAFFDALEVQKGPSLGTNFTLACPYAILAHYVELEWANEFGVETDLIRISVGLEDKEDLMGRLQRAMSVVQGLSER